MWRGNEAGGETDDGAAAPARPGLFARPVVAIGALSLAALAGAGAGLLFPGGGAPVIARALPPVKGAALPPIAGSADKSAPLVVIDPGHGGFDPGASSEAGAREKDIVLALALDVRERLLALGGIRVAMTRDTDTFLPLEQRPQLAEALGADAFVSIHADSAAVPDARGANAYVLSARASDREAQALAAVENESASGIDLGDNADDVAAILADLLKRETTLGSIDLARAMERESVGRMPVHPPFRRAANFVVLRSAETPSILFEAGYLTNVDDATRLGDAKSRAPVADALARAILTHLLAPERRR